MKTIINLIYPPICPICKTILPHDQKTICKPCMEELSLVTSPKCLKCGKQIESKEQEYCFDCDRLPKSFIKGYPVYIYQEPLKKAILDFKYQNKREYADFFAKSIIFTYEEELKHINPDGIVPIPLHQKKKKARGYNQAELIAKIIGKTLEIPVFPKYIERSTDTIPQKELNSKERMKNLKNAFKISENKVQLKKVLLIDDIYTSGATIEACTQILLMNGTNCVYYACIAIGNDI